MVDVGWSSTTGEERRGSFPSYILETVQFYHVSPRRIFKKGLIRKPCCAPSINQCLIALPDERLYNSLYIFTVETGPVEEAKEWDCLVTQEVTCLFDVSSFLLIGVVDKYNTRSLRKFLYGDNSGFMDQDGFLPRQRALQLEVLNMMKPLWKPVRK